MSIIDDVLILYRISEKMDIYKLNNLLLYYYPLSLFNMT